MWQLTVFRVDNDELVAERNLPDCDGAAVRRLLRLADSEPLHGEFPLGPEHRAWLVERLGDQPDFDRLAYFVGETRDA